VVLGWITLLGVFQFEDTEFPLENNRHRISGHVRGSENAFLCFFLDVL